MKKILKTSFIILTSLFLVFNFSYAEEEEKFISCLEDNGVIIYGADYCPACDDLVESLGGYDVVDPIYVNCMENRDKCDDEMQTNLIPEIQINNELYEESRDPEDLAKETGCEYIERSDSGVDEEEESIEIPEGDYVESKIMLDTGWNIVSTPRVLENYEFSGEEISENFDIFVLNPTDPSGWSTMQEIGQNKFEPLYAYFINNKTEEEQQLDFEYDYDIDPPQMLFERELKPGWNAVGVASPDYVLNEHYHYQNLNNPKPILNSIVDDLDLVVDFTYGNKDSGSVNISDSWKSKTPEDVNQLDDFRNFKGYGVYVNEQTKYIGTQTLDKNLVKELSIRNLSAYVHEEERNIAYIDEPVELNVSVQPWHLHNVDISWSIENIDGEAEIDQDGVLKGLEEGRVEVTVKAEDGSEVSDTKEISVKERNMEIINTSEGEIEIGENETKQVASFKINAHEDLEIFSLGDLGSFNNYNWVERVKVYVEENNEPIYNRPVDVHYAYFPPLESGVEISEGESKKFRIEMTTSNINSEREEISLLFREEMTIAKELESGLFQTGPKEREQLNKVTLKGEEREGTLSVEKHEDNPGRKVHQIESEKELELLKFQLSSQDRANLKELTVDLKLDNQGSADLEVGDVVEEAFLYEYNHSYRRYFPNLEYINAIDSKSLGENQVIFNTDIGLRYSKDFVVVAELSDFEEDVENSFDIKAEINNEENNEIAKSARSGDYLGLKNSVAGNYQSLFNNLLKIGLVDSYIIPKEDYRQAEGFLEMEVVAAGGDVEMRSVDFIDEEEWKEVDLNITVDGKQVDSESEVIIEEAETVLVEITATGRVEDSGYYRMAVNSIGWLDGKDNNFVWSEEDYEFIENLRTPKIYLVDEDDEYDKEIVGVEFISETDRESVLAGEKDIEVAEMEIEAKEGDLDLRDITVNLSAWKDEGDVDGETNKRIRELVSSVTVYPKDYDSGGHFPRDPSETKIIGTEKVGSETESKIRFDNWDISLEEGEAETFAIKINTELDEEGYLQIDFDENNAVTLIDSDNVVWTKGEKKEIDFKIESPDIDFKIWDTGEVESGVVKVEGDKFEEVDLAEIAVKNKSYEYGFSGFSIDLEDNQEYLDYLYAYEGSNLLDEQKVDGSDNYNLSFRRSIEIGETKEFTIKGETRKISENESGGAIKVTDIDARWGDADVDFNKKEFEIEIKSIPEGGPVIKSTDVIEGGINLVEEDQSNEVDLLEFGVSTGEEVYFEDITVDYYDGFAGENESGYIDKIALYNESELIGEKEANEQDGTVAFDIDHQFSSGDVENFMVVAKTHNILREDQGYTIKAGVDDVSAYKSESNKTAKEVEIDAEGGEFEIYVVIPDFTLLDSGIDVFGDNDDMGDGFIEFEVEALDGDIALDYINFSNTGDGEFHSGLVTYDGEEVEAVELDGTADMGDIVELTESVNATANRVTLAGAENMNTYSSETAGYSADDYVMDDAGEFSTGAQYDVWEVVGVGADGDADYTFVEGDGSGVAEDTIEVATTDYIGYTGADLDDEVLLSTDLTPTSDGTTDYTMDTNDESVWEVTSGEGNADISEIAPTDYEGYADSQADDAVAEDQDLSGLATGHHMNNDTYEVVVSNSDAQLTDYVGYADAAAGDVVVDGGWDALFEDEIADGNSVEITVEGMIYGAGSKERIKVQEIGWLTEDGDYGNYDGEFGANDYDAVDALESARKSISNY